MLQLRLVLVVFTDALFDVMSAQRAVAADVVRFGLVHFLRFQLRSETIASIKQGEAIALGIDLPAYNYRIEELAPETQSMLSEDLH